MKTCAWCGVYKPLADFVKRYGRAKAHCKHCNRLRQKEQYHANPTRRLKAVARNIRNFRHRRAANIDAVKNVPCADCGRSYPPYVMDFDHRDSQTKTGNVSDMVKQYNAGLARLLDEIAKCDVVCSNCHRVRTHARLARGSSQDREALG